MMPSLVILAAGVGSRYGGLKQLDAVGPSGETILEYSVFDAARAGFGRAILVVRPDTEAEFRKTVGARIGDLIPVDYVHQRLDDLPDGLAPPRDRAKPWGTGQAVLCAEAAVTEPFAVINADDFYGAESYLSLASFLGGGPGASKTDFCLQGFRIGPTLSEAGAVSRGLCRADAHGWLESIVEVFEVRKQGSGGRYRGRDGVEHRLDGDELVSMNMWGFTPIVFRELRRSFAAFLARSADDPGTEFLLPAAIQQLIDHRRARVRVLPEADQWCGITYREDRSAVMAHIAGLVAQGVYPPRLWS
jgi:hypothetical protein